MEGEGGRGTLFLRDSVTSAAVEDSHRTHSSNHSSLEQAKIWHCKPVIYSLIC